MSIRGRLLKHSIPVTETGCWLWTASALPSGYGQINVATEKGRRPLLAHRVSYEEFVGPAGDAFVLHRCDVPACVNPAHLFLGNHQANMDDKVAKGRQRKGMGIPQAKLTDQQVQEILWLRGLKTQREVAKHYGVSQSLVSLLQSGKSRRHLLDHEF